MLRCLQRACGWCEQAASNMEWAFEHPAEPQAVGLDVCLALSRRHVQAHMGEVIARNVQ
jgi:hypothetical protein